MKKLLNTLLALSLIVTIACNKDEEQPLPEETPSNLVELSGSLSTQTLDASKKYLLKGQVFVEDGVTLTIPAGTVIMGDKATKAVLVIKMGGKLMAQGTAAQPIIFTSEQAVGERDKGDWGGIVLLGKANVNQASTSIEGITPAVSYGTYNSTANDDDNSGILQYVRIEFAGIAISPNNETNSLTMGAVGNGTTIDHVQTSFGGDDGFEWFGGTVDCKNIISLATYDDDFDCDFGYQGNVQYALAIRGYDADVSLSNGFEVDNNGAGDAATPRTIPVFSNVTILGPKSDSSTSINGNYGNAIHVKKNGAVSIFNSIFAGYAKGVQIESANTTFANYNPGTNGVFSNNILAFTKNGNSQPTWFAGDAGTEAYWNTNNKKDTIFTNTSKVTDWPAIGISESLFFSENTLYPADPSFTTVTATGTQMPSPDFTHTKITNAGAFFTTTTFVGAFGATDWTDTWSNFDPKNASY